MKYGGKGKSSTAYEVLTRYKTRATLLWASCIDKARTTNEIAEAWEYAGGIVLHQDSLLEKMQKTGLLKVDRIERRFAYYKASLDRYFEVLEVWLDMHPGHFSKEDSKPVFPEIVLDDRKALFPIINSALFKSTFFELALLRDFARHTKTEIGNLDRFILLPAYALETLVTLGAFMQKIGSKPKNEKEFAIDKKHWSRLAAHIFDGYSFVGWNPNAYMNRIAKQLSFKNFNLMAQQLNKTKFSNSAMSSATWYVDIYWHIEMSKVHVERS